MNDASFDLLNKWYNDRSPDVGCVHSQAASLGTESGTILVSPLVVRGQSGEADRSREKYKH